jgi:Tfp pilus assembly protein PilP
MAGGTGLTQWRARGATAVSVVSARRSSAFGAFWQAALAAALGLALPWGLLGKGLWDEREQLSQRRQHLLREQQDMQARVQALQGQLAQHAATAVADVSPSIQPAAARLMLHRLALQHGVHLEQLKPLGDGVSRTGLAGSASAAGQAPTDSRDTGLRVRLRGSYGALLAFVRALGESGPLWALRQLHLEAGARREHRLALVLEALPPGPGLAPTAGQALGVWTRPAFDPFSAPRLIATPVARGSEPPAVKDPLADVPEIWRAEFVRERQPLEAMALRDLVFTGTLRQGPVWLALMRGRDAVHTVKVGDYLGPDLGRVQRIDEDGLELRELRRDGGGHWAEHLRRWRVGGAP